MEITTLTLPANPEDAARLVKILKKYDKRTGALLRSPFIQKVLHQPFFTTDLLYKLVKECETLLDRLFPIIELRSRIDQPTDGDDPSTSTAAKNDDDLLLGGSIPKGLAEIEYVKSLYMKSTITALRVLRAEGDSEEELGRREAG
ncbi:hypothetical protein U1Q18_037405 [Sarracenia purpurea var. burkii]